MSRRSGRSDTSDRRYRANRAALLAADDICALCGHPGAKTADHKIPKRAWLLMHGSADGFNDMENLQPAHGTMGNRAINPCPDCGKLCNQSRGERPMSTPHSREW